MSKKELTSEQKRLDVDLWIIFVATVLFYGIFAIFGKRMMDFVSNEQIPIFQRLLFASSIQYGIAGLGITVVCVLRKQSFASFGLRKEGAIRAIVGTILCCVPYIVFLFLSGRFEGYQPLGILLADDILKAGVLFSFFGMLLIAVVWGFFEGFNYVVVCDKINQRYPNKNRWLDYGALLCAIICLLMHPFSLSFPDIIEAITSFIIIYGMLIVKRETNNAWGCVFAFLFIWNAF